MLPIHSRPVPSAAHQALRLLGPRLPQRGRQRCRAASDDPGSIDELVRRLSEQASKMGEEYRQSSSESDDQDDDRLPPAGAPSGPETGPFGVEVRVLMRAQNREHCIACMHNTQLNVTDGLALPSSPCVAHRGMPSAPGQG